MNDKFSRNMVSKKEVLNKINDLLSEIVSKYEELAEEQNVDQLDYELFEVNAVFFAEHAKILRKLVTPQKIDSSLGQSSVREGVSKEFTVISEEDEYSTASRIEEDEIVGEESFVAPDLIVGESASNSTERELDPMESELVFENDEIIAEEDEITVKQPDLPVQEFNPVIVPVEAVVQEVVKEIIVEEKAFSFKVDEEIERVTEVLSVSESFSESKPQSINERISALRQSSSGDLNQSINLNRVKDIKSIINLNDKLLFIKDLFNGYSLAYSEAIELLNRYENFSDADLFLQNNYAEKNNWNAKSETVDKLYTILRKRYA